MTARGARERGFSLVELMIALVISMVVIAGALALLTSQQRSFRASASDRALQETARLAVDHVATNLRLAGFGVDPSFAFDFGAQADVPMARAAPGTAVSKPAWKCASAVTCRDRIDSPDEVVFLARDPAFGRTLAQPASASELVLAGPLVSPLRAGQILQVMCFTGNMLWAFVTG
jgi:type II secretory pathway pseudopilin PulG